MQYTIRNEHMQAVIDSLGAELVSLQLDGHEYLWQGDPAFWRGHAPVLFPFVGRLQGGTYTLHGTEYALRIHGLAKYYDFTPEKEEKDALTLSLSANEETRAQYPFSFRFLVTYRLKERRLAITFRVENEGAEMMYFGLGGHPGFRAPMEEGEDFTDCYLEFSEASHPDRVLFSDGVLTLGKTKPYPLEEGKILRLHHDLFDHDAVVLTDMPWTVSLKSTKSSRSVTVSYPGMPYVGFWHAVKKPAPYVCIEPWVSLPGRDGITEDFAAMSGLQRLAPGKTYENDWSIALT